MAHLYPHYNIIVTARFLNDIREQNMTLEWRGAAQNALVDAIGPGYHPPPHLLVLGGLHTVLLSARLHQLLKKQSSFHLQAGRSRSSPQHPGLWAALGRDLS